MLGSVSCYDSRKSFIRLFEHIYIFYVSTNTTMKGNSAYSTLMMYIFFRFDVFLFLQIFIVSMNEPKERPNSTVKMVTGVVLDTTAACNFINYGSHGIMREGASLIASNALFREKQLIFTARTKFFHVCPIALNADIRSAADDLINQPRYAFGNVADILRAAADRVVSVQGTVVTERKHLF